MADTANEPMYYGLTLAQFRERIKKLATEKGLKGEKLERVAAQALDMIPTIRLDEASQR
ncbi:hypothetical protein [Methylobacterium aerolatum]|uniref:Uncharacterized protein n=1 Tax=Methylobacterium aerolatum TaxID=418708 RepID=A0ABU0HY06_9HYPH|nr:hypothetical protein [Methylobacterium aerolatum]MDQ0447228.1 hypothetical protein [Methylobacterium aerolatum]GJD36896.1 hypothetical protein FMGBMHLM_3820 [Methylobacterium aerolatum]